MCLQIGFQSTLTMNIKSYLGSCNVSEDSAVKSNSLNDGMMSELIEMKFS